MEQWSFSVFLYPVSVNTQYHYKQHLRLKFMDPWTLTDLHLDKIYVFLIIPYPIFNFGVSSWGGKISKQDRDKLDKIIKKP